MYVEQAIEMLLSDADALSAWLTAQPLDAVVGYREDASACPVHTYLVSQLSGFDIEHIGAVQVRERTTFIHMEAGSWALPNPPRIQKFIQKVDGFMQADIRANEAIYLLSTC